MSYRAFKRLLGETSLERKCRFLFGAFILLLITGSFWLYARQTEHLAYEQIVTTCRLLVIQIIDRDLATTCRPVPGPDQPTLAATTSGLLASALGQGPLLSSTALGSSRYPSRPPDEDRKKTAQVLDEFRKSKKDTLPEGFEYSTFKPNAVFPENRPDPSSVAQFREFEKKPKLQEANHLVLAERKNHYYAAIRATTTCLGCHQQSNPELKEDGLIAVIKIAMPTDAIEGELAVNRAFLISTALLTAILIMGGSYIIVRYVIVKPVKHLKEVSDAISAGELNVPQRDPDRRRVRGPQSRLQPDVAQPGEHAGSSAQGQHRSGSQGR